MNRQLIKIMGICLILPTTVLGIGLIINELISEKIISTPVGIAILLAVIVAIFYKIFKINNEKEDE